MAFRTVAGNFVADEFIRVIFVRLGNPVKPLRSGKLLVQTGKRHKTGCLHKKPVKDGIFYLGHCAQFYRKNRPLVKGFKWFLSSVQMSGIRKAGQIGGLDKLPPFG